MLKLIEEQDDLMRGIILVFKLFGFMFCIFVLLICYELVALIFVLHNLNLCFKVECCW